MASLALLYQLHRRFTEARMQYQGALSVFTQLGDQVNINKTLTNLGLVCQEEGDLDQAYDYLEQSLTGYREFGDVHGEANGLVNLARLCAKQGDLSKAETFAAAARTLSEKFGFADQLARLAEFNL
ncbi:MAG: tetratricopeptide repeat protein [Chloroflexota bacterium]|nr:tetratricopeptide repeat protein [Chloroflexota bacterium]